MDIQQFYTQEIEPLRQASLTLPHPNFFIVGAARSGTTSLWSYLKQHPDIAMPIDEKDKEPSFFSWHFRWRPSVEKYLGLFADAVGKTSLGEASTAYLSSPESAELIHRTYPQAKIIIILRNPFEHAFSLYQWMVREGYEWFYPFEKALAAEEDRVKDGQFEFQNPQYYYNYLYYHSGLYSEQITRYIERFPKKQIKIVLFDDLRDDPIRIVQELYAFLGVNPGFLPIISIHNRSRIPLWILGQCFFRQRLRKILMHCHIPYPYSKWLMTQALAANIFLGRCRSLTLHPGTRRALQQRYENDIRTTSQLIARNLDMWLITILRTFPVYH